MFDKNEYWEKKRERQQLSEARGFFARLKFMSLLSDLWGSKDDTEEKPVVTGKHTRSMKERMMRRHRHASRMRNAA